LDPSDTTARHGIPAFPITGLSVTSYSEAMRRSIGDGAQAESHRKAAVAASTPSRGDFLRKGVKAIPLVGSTLRFLRRKWQAARQIPAEVRHLTQSYRIVRELDLLLVSGGGQLDEEFGGPWGHPYALFRWAMLARLAGTPFAIASVGVGYLNRPLSRFFLRHALASAEYRSYRDPGSKERLARWRFTHNDPCVPDIAFSMEFSAAPSGRAGGSGRIVGVSPMIYGHARHWPTERAAVYEGYSRRLAEFAEWLLERGNTLLLFHSSSADRVAIADLKSRLGERLGAAAGRRVLEPPIHTVAQFFDEVAKADCVVASRLHGVLMSHLLDKPVLAISFDRKVDAHMESVAQSDYRVDISRFEVAELIERFQDLERNADSVRATVARHVAEFRHALADQYDALLDLAGAPRANLTPSARSAS
jgi:polysaccharide pyruvyl transferase WcaK-like protein